MEEREKEKFVVSFEAIKVGQSFGREGYLLKLGVRPSETPPELASFPQGKRFMVVIVPLPDRDEEIGAFAVQQAGILCKERSFWTYLQLFIAPPYTEVTSESVAVRVVRDYFGLMSRAELRSDPVKREDFLELRRDYLMWVERNGTNKTPASS